MFKSTSSLTHLRSLILLLLLLSADVHLNPGPFAFMRSMVIDGVERNLTIPVDSTYNSVKIAFSMSVEYSNNQALTITSTAPGMFFNFEPQIGGMFISQPMEIGPISSSFTLTFTPSGPGKFHILISISFSSDTIQLDTTNPIPVTGQVSIINPIPSVTSTILSAFKR